MKLLTYPKFRVLKDDGSFAAGWKVYSYAAGTSTPQATYTDSTLGAANTNPIVLDGAGECSLWLDPSKAYKIVITDEADVQQRTVDGINSVEPGSFTTLAASGASTLKAISGTTLALSGQITSTVASGTAPLVIASSTKVANLNADKLDDGDWAAPGVIGATTPNTGKFSTLEATGNVTQSSANGAQAISGQISEEITLSTASTTTDSTANLLPANSIIEAVTARVTESITGATDWKLGDGTTAARFCGAQATTQLIAGATKVALDHRNPDAASSAAGPVQSAAAKLRITTTGTPGAGKIRVTVFFRQFVAPSS